jgi:hypothetical protein
VSFQKYYSLQCMKFINHNKQTSIQYSLMTEPRKVTFCYLFLFKKMFNFFHT